MKGTKLKTLARTLRRSQTDTEGEFWKYLRSRNFQGCKFRRQQPIGHYIVDFCCLERKLVIEVDGGQHAVQVERDKQRTIFLEQEGFRVVRFWDNDIFENSEGVLETILELLKESPSPQPSPLKGEGEQREPSPLKGEGKQRKPSPLKGEGKQRKPSPLKGEGEQRKPSPLKGEGTLPMNSPLPLGERVGVRGIVRLCALLLCAFAPILGAEEPSWVTNLPELFDTPNAEIVNHYGYTTAFRFYSTGGVLAKTYFGVLPRLNIGFGIDVERLIGKDTAHLNEPTINIKYRFFDGRNMLPAMAIGYDGQGFLFDQTSDKYTDREKGLYLAGTNEIITRGLELNAGININDFEKNKVYAFAGLSYIIENRLQIMAEYDNIHSAPQNRVNAGFRLFLTPAVSIDLAGRNVGRSGAERIARINYTGSF